MSGGALIVFLKNPDSENVKTRLAKDTGRELARKVYEKLIKHTLDESFSSEAKVHLFFSGGIPEDKKFGDAAFFTQTGEHLGERMKNAFQDVFNRGFKKAVIIGSDCPEISGGHINQALSVLDIADVVIGPADDGGYYLLGMKTLHHALFENKNWSTDSVLTDTIADFRALGLNYVQLPAMTDIDTIEDYHKFPDFQVS